MDKQKCFLYPGHIFVSKEPHQVSTVLGSCVSVCIWDPVNSIGGMNHHIHSEPFDYKDRTSQYGSIAIPYMIKMLIDLGGIKANFKAHIIGGAQKAEMGSFNIGKENIAIAENILRKNFIQIITCDTGGEMGRKVVFDTQSGELIVYKVNNLRESDWYVN